MPMIILKNAVTRKVGYIYYIDMNGSLCSNKLKGFGKKQMKNKLSPRRFTLNINNMKWKVKTDNVYCNGCNNIIEDKKDGFFNFNLKKKEYWREYNDGINIRLCKECFNRVKNKINDQKPDLTEVYNVKYKEAMVRGIEKGNNNGKK